MLQLRNRHLAAVEMNVVLFIFLFLPASDNSIENYVGLLLVSACV
jgi:hypothetical protein